MNISLLRRAGTRLSKHILKHSLGTFATQLLNLMYV